MVIRWLAERDVASKPTQEGALMRREHSTVVWFFAENHLDH